MMPETRFTEIQAFTIDPRMRLRVGISRSASEKRKAFTFKSIQSFYPVLPQILLLGCSQILSCMKSEMFSNGDI